MNALELNLTALVGSRICHDLISPIGAIGNGVELLQLSGHASSPEVALIAESVENANTRLRMFRIAFGAADPNQLIGKRDLQSIIDSLSKASRATIGWTVEGETPRILVRSIFLIMQCLESALPMGGEIAITRTETGATLTARNGELRIEDDMWKALETKTIGVPAANRVQFALLPLFMAECGQSIALEISETEISVTLTS